jgi:DNA polymerase
VDAWLPGDPPPRAVEAGAHNGQNFDRFAAARAWGWPLDGIAVDTSEAARRAGLPGALDALGTRWLGLPKDAAASKYTKALSKYAALEDAPPPNDAPAADGADAEAKRARAKARVAQLREWRHRPASERRELVTRYMLGYCASDVEILAHGWPRLRPFLEDGVFSGWEADVSAVDRIVNDRGVAFASDLARALLKCDAQNQVRALVKAARTLNNMSAIKLRALVSSPEQFCERTGASNAQAATVEALLADPAAGAEVHAFCRARQSLASIVSGKLTAGLARVSADGRMRDNHKYYGAHTGRWSGQGMQLQNLTRPEKRFEGWGDAEVCALVDRALRGEDLDDGEIVIALRACVWAGPGRALAVCDFSGVEARAIAWCASDRGALDVFASGRDVYKTAAAPMFGVSYDDVTKVQRNAGKMAELACGYQGGTGALLKIAGQNRFSFEAVGIDPADVVAAFRKQHPALVRFWRALGDAFIGAVRGTPSRVDRFDFVPSSDGKDVAIFLPSGRPIIYNDVGIHRDERGRPSAYYAGTKFQEHVYGGKIAENVIQAMCRDLMADALVRAEEAGLCPVLHVHDEVVVDVDGHAGAEALEELSRIMLDVPEWAEGFPVGAAGHFGRRYRK